MQNEKSKKTEVGQKKYGKKFKWGAILAKLVVYNKQRKE